MASSDKFLYHRSVRPLDMLQGVVTSILLHSIFLVGSKYWYRALMHEPKQEIRGKGKFHPFPPLLQEVFSSSRTLLIFMCCEKIISFHPLPIRDSNARFPLFAMLQGDL